MADYRKRKTNLTWAGRTFTKAPQPALVSAVLNASASNDHVLVITDSDIRPVLVERTGARDTRRWLVLKDSMKRYAPLVRGQKKPKEAGAKMISVIHKGWSLTDLKLYPPQVVVIDGDLKDYGRWAVEELMPFGSHDCTFIYVLTEKVF